MKIIRFLDENNKIKFGHNYKDGKAEVLSDSPLYDGKPAGKYVEVKKLLAPIDPKAILCIGLNYKAHADEMGFEYPKWPILFMKNPGAVTNPEDPVIIPACSVGPEVDYECELTAIIGKDAGNVTPDKALDYVLGYTVGNDVSARRWQKNAGEGQWVRGKSFDTFCPVGPCIVTKDEIPDPQTLNLSTILNGEVMQSSNTSDMIFTVAEMIAELSKDMTILAGSIIMTGTPGGIGSARNPQVFLKPGDKITCKIDNIGELNNYVIDAS